MPSWLRLPKTRTQRVRCRPVCAARSARGNLSFAEEYVTLLALEEGGGIALTLDAWPRLPLKQLRLSGAFFGFEDDESLTTICFGALPHHYIVKGLLDTYQTENIFNTALLPLPTGCAIF